MKIADMIRKDLKIILSDKKALVTILLMPVILTAILSSALRGAFSDGEGIGKIQIAVVKEYHIEEESEKFLETLKGSLLTQNMGKDALDRLAEGAEKFDIEKIFFKEFLDSEALQKFVEYRITDEENALQQLRDKAVSAVVVLPRDFVYNMKINVVTPFRNQVSIKVIGHPEREIGRQIVQSIMEAFTDNMAAIMIGKNVILETALSNSLGTDAFEDMEAIVDRINNELRDIEVEITALKAEGRRQVSSFAYYAAAMMTMFILFAAGHGGRLLLDEKDNITYNRMVIAGVPKTGILTGKFFTIFVLALVQISVMVSFSSLMLKVYWGSFPAVALISISAAFAVAGIGAMISAATFKSGNDKMANIFETAVIQTMALLGGSFFPIEILPSFMQKLSIFSLNGIALKAYLKIMRGYGVVDILGYLASLVIVGIVFSTLAAFIFNRKGRGERCSA